MNEPRTLKAYSGISLLLLAYLAFIALGMRDGLLGVAWPSMRVDFSRPLDALGVLLVAGVAGYMTASFLIGSLITRLGIGKLLAIGFSLASFTLIAYSLIPSWWVIVMISVVGGFGSGVIDAGLNTHLAAHYGEGPMQWLHASYGIGITLGPIIMTIALAKIGSWRAGYLAVGIIQMIVLACVALTLRPWQNINPAETKDGPKRLTDYRTPILETLRQAKVWLSAAMFFLYVGAEVALGTWIYSLLVESRGVNPSLAGFLTGSYWATFTIGRVAAGLYAKRLGANRLVLAGLLGALLGAILLAWNPSTAANLVAVGLVGFCIAPIFPALMSGTSQRVGMRFAANTIGIQMAATGLGTAVIPGLFGVLARQYSLEIIPTLLLVVFVALFGTYLLSSKTRHQEISA